MLNSIVVVDDGLSTLDDLTTAGNSRLPGAATHRSKNQTRLAKTKPFAG
jgi:hypothetical protein